MKKILVIGSLNMDFVAGVSHIPTIGETIFCLLYTSDAADE